MPKRTPRPEGRTLGAAVSDPRQMRGVQRHLGRELGRLYDWSPPSPNARLADLARRLDAKAAPTGDER